MFKHTPQDLTRVTLLAPGLAPIRLDFAKMDDGETLQMRVVCDKKVKITHELMPTPRFIPSEIPTRKLVDTMEVQA